MQGWIHGGHPSRRLGVSTEFDHHKSYQPGDPIKSIDWKASARHDRFYIKRSIEDSALSVRLVGIGHHGLQPGELLADLRHLASPGDGLRQRHG